MPYAKKYKKTYKRKPRRRKAKANTFKQNHRAGDYHQQTFASGGALIPSTTARFKAHELSDISKGDLLTNRQTNIVQAKSLNVRMSLRNTANNQRVLRMVCVRLRGSQTTADVTNWSNLLISNTFAPTPLTGNDFNSVYRINQDIFEKVYDRKIYIKGTGYDSPSTQLDFNIPLKKYISYTYNSDVARKGALFWVMFACESTNLTPAITPLEFEYQLTHHYYDVIRSTSL